MLLRPLIAVLCASLLSACTIPFLGDNPALVAEREKVRPLEMPPDLIRPTSNTLYTVPQAAAGAQTRTPAQAQAAAAPQAVRPATATQARSVEDRLQELQALRQQGLISDEELTAQRRKILDSL